MALAPGTRLGPYEIAAALGAGGMGEVYRARDTTLNRDVAIKVLPESFAGDPERLARFTREAQTLASLNHPNIAIVHGFEQAGDTHALVMELVPGEDLSQRIARGAVPLDEALLLAKQIAEALEAAHEQGVIHRDLKPANIKVRPDGAVKVLDFGLAKAMADDPRRDEANSLTVAAHRTVAGVILGTAAYMSPEQARGKAVDKRADVWAFGCVLFEMLAGRLAFGGATTADIIAAVVDRPPDWSTLPARVPRRIRDLLRRCLHKDPRQRLHDIADARLSIEDALGPAIDDVQEPRPAVPRAWAGLRAAWVGAGVVAIGVTTFIAVKAMRAPAPAPAEAVRVTVAAPPEGTLALGRGSAVALSPDGRRLVYVVESKGRTQLFVRRLDQFEASPVAGTDGATNPFFSPDGAWVGFFADGKLKKTALDGGTPVILANVRAARGEAWGPDNAIFFTPVNTSAIMKVSANGSATQAVTTLAEGEFSHRWPQILPGGKAVLFSIWNDAGWELAHIAVENLETHARKVLVQGGGYGRYVEDGLREGYLVYARAEGLMAAPFDLPRLEPTGPSVPVVDGVITNLSGGAHFSIAGNGTLAYVRGSVGEADRDLVWTGLDGATKGPIRMKNNGQMFRLSPDGSRILYNNATGPNRDLWIDNFVRGTTTRVTSQGNNYGPIWSHDGRWVTYGKDLPATNLFRRPVEGGQEERLTTSVNAQTAGDWSPDGTTLVYTEFDPVSGSDIWRLTLGSKPTPFLQTRFNEGNATISPDGRSLAYQSNESGRFEIYVRSFPDGEKRWQLSLEGGIVPVWSPTGRDLFFRSTGNQMMAASVTAGREAEWTKPRALFDARPYEDRYSVSPDGQRFLMMPHFALDAAPTQVNVVLNWVSELRQRLRRP